MCNKVSIITPVYNCEAYLADMINSVLCQSYTDWELVLVDDCSTDNSRDIMHDFALQDSRLICIHLKQNGGAANARNIGIENTTGDFIAFLDSDDKWTKNKLLIQVEFMNKNNYIFSFTGYEIIDKNNMFIGEIKTVPNRLDYKRLLKNNRIGCLTVLIRRNGIKNIQFEKIGHEDYALWLNILKDNDILAYGISDVLGSYRKLENSLSSNKLRTINWTWNIYKNNQGFGLLKSIGLLFRFIIFTTLKHMGVKK